MMKEQDQKQIKIHYSDTATLFSSQFLVNSTSEDITVGFSSGYMKDPGSSDTSLPIHSRISMTHAGAKRLHDILGKVLAGNAAISGSAGGETALDDKKH